MLGEILADTLQASKVDTSFCARTDLPTTVAFVKLVNGQATYAFYDENTAGRLLSVDQLPSLPAEIGTLFFGGISLVNDPAASTYEALQAREAGNRVTMIDPNIRPGFIAGKEDQYRARIERMIARADIVKLSDEDLHRLEGAGDLVELARGILAKGPKIVFITEGAAGGRRCLGGRGRRLLRSAVRARTRLGRMNCESRPSAGQPRLGFGGWRGGGADRGGVADPDLCHAGRYRGLGGQAGGQDCQAADLQG